LLDDLKLTNRNFLSCTCSKRIQEANEPYKLDILQSLNAQSTISIYHVGSKWWDLCAGPHVSVTKEIPSTAIDLLSVAGAYWRGDDKNAMLQVSNGIDRIVSNLNSIDRI
jgi:threonyl-tRNA synthetase